jgi:hypothetical protein
MAFGSNSYGSSSYGSSGGVLGTVDSYLMICFPGNIKIKMGMLPLPTDVDKYDKYGYINNPRWTKDPASLSEHSPCGYWWRGEDKEPECGPVWTLPK